VGVLALSTSALIQAQTVPNRIDYQGRVLDGNGDGFRLGKSKD
jgi:hypothetical protein